MFADYTMHNKLTKLMAESFLPRDIIKDFCRHYRNNGLTTDARIARLVESLDKAVAQWDVPIGPLSILSTQVTEHEKTLVTEKRIIEAIKSVRQRTGLNLREAKTIVDNYRFSK